MSNLMHYDCSNISSSIKEIKVATSGDVGSLKVTYKDSDTEYEYSGVEIDKLVDLERCFRKLSAKPQNGAAHNGSYKERWSIGKFFNRNIANETKYKVKK